MHTIASDIKIKSELKKVSHFHKASFYAGKANLSAQTGRDELKIS
jgi:hypothetical protein